MDRYEFHEVLDSTQTRAAEWAREGAPHGSLVVAGRQESGRGRAGRRWASPPGGLWVSMVVRPRSAEGLTLLGGLACARLARRYGVTAELRWPNDVYVGERKLAGVLAEARVGAQSVEFVVLGLGLNVNVLEWDEDVPATSLQLLLGRELDLQDALGGLVQELDALLELHEREGQAGYRAEIESLFKMVGRKVELDTSQGTKWGRVAGLDPSGALRLDDGSVHYVVERLRLMDEHQHDAEEQ